MDEKADVDYRNSQGERSAEYVCFRQAVKMMVRLFGPTPAQDFDTPRLSVDREAMISGSWMTNEERKTHAKRERKLGWCRNFSNRSVGRLRCVFKWGVVNKLVPAATQVDIQCLPALRHGRGGALAEATSSIPSVFTRKRIGSGTGWNSWSSSSSSYVESRHDTTSSRLRSSHLPTLPRR
jgi:hypothetical protein